MFTYLNIVAGVLLLLASNAFAQTIITCGGVEDTATLNAAFSTGGGTFCIVGTCVAGNIVVSPGATSSVPETVSLTRCGSILAGSVTPTFIAKPGTTGTFIDARSLANSGIAHIAISCAGTAASPCLDTSWGYAGASVLNHYTDVSISNYTGVGWDAENNNDSEFDHVIANVGIPGQGSGTQIAIDMTACGGGETTHDSYWYGGMLELSAQNAVIASSGGSGIRVNQGCTSTNYITLIGDYIYANPSSGYAIWDPSPTGTGHTITALTSIGTIFVGLKGSKAAFNFTVGSGKINLTGNQFIGIKPGT